MQSVAVVVLPAVCSIDHLDLVALATSALLASATKTFTTTSALKLSCNRQDNSGHHYQSKQKFNETTFSIFGKHENTSFCASFCQVIEYLNITQLIIYNKTTRCFVLNALKSRL